MSQDVYVDCGSGEDAYRVILTGKDRKAFKRASEEAWIKGKQGEELVTALMTILKRDITKVVRRNKAGLSDGPEGQPGCQTFGDGGRLTMTEHYKDGKLNDSIHGDPAVQKFYGDNKTVLKEYYRDGVRNDGAHGEAAYQRFNGLGKRMRIERWRNGLRHDGINGEAAVLEFDDDGALAQILHYKEGRFIQEGSSTDVKGDLRNGKKDHPPFSP